MLPSVSTTLAPKPSCSVNVVLTSVLPMSEVPLTAVPLQTEAESATFDTAEDADSESQEGETDPPDNKKSGWYSVKYPVVLNCREKGHASICLFGFKIRGVV